jgi:hypothetical protein
MPISYEIDTAAQLVLARVTGVLTHEDILGYQQSVWSRPEVVGFDELVDVTDVERIAFESSRRVGELAAVAAGMDASSKSGRLAIVAPTPESYGLARMYQTYRETSPGSTKLVKVFHTLDDAWTWLGKRPSVPDTSVKSSKQKQ